jgi:hypothetical protein
MARMYENVEVLDALTQVRSLAGDCISAPAWPLSNRDLVDCLDSIHQAEQALAAVKLHLVREAEGRALPKEHGAANTAVWLRERLRIGISAARQIVELSTAVDQRSELDAALGKAEVNVEQAQVIAKAMAGLPKDVCPDVATQAEQALVGYAAQFEPGELRKLGRQILRHVAPDEAERAEKAALEREETRAHETRAFTLTSTADGRVRVTGWLDREAAAVVNAALDPLCSPRQAPAGDTRTAAQRRADALVDVCRRALYSGDLPEHGGDRPHLVVTTAFDVLRGQLGMGTLDTGEPLTAEQVRRIACDAQIIPAVLGGDGQVLDLGMSRRLFTGAVRRALVLRDGGCAFPGCDRPASWCEAHHLKGFADGGPTSVDNGVLLCGFHHRLIHHSEWEVRLGADRLPDFIPPAHLDPLRRPRRNIFHRRP